MISRRGKVATESPVSRLEKMREDLIKREAVLVSELAETRRALVLLGRRPAGPRRVSYGATTQAVYDAVLAHGDEGCYAREVVERTGIDRNTVWHVLKRLEGSGDVRHEGPRMHQRYYATGGNAVCGKDGG